MNVLEFLKNGSGIHIKKKNRGKFTDYCGGKVTDECIQRGKNSSNPAIRKRATFAANARKWKHKKGGKAFVPGASITDSRPEAYWEIKKKKKRLEKKQLGGYIYDYSNPNAMGGIFGETMLRRQYEQEQLRQKELMKQQKAQLEAQQIQQEADRTSGLINTIGNIGLNFLANKALSKNGVPNSLTQQQPNMLKDVGFKSNVLNNNIINNTSVDEMRNLILQ